MGALTTVLTVLFIILCILIIILVLLQSDKSAGMGLLGGGSQSTFGSSTADVITKITAVMVALFMLGSLGLAILKSPKKVEIGKDKNKAEVQTQVLNKEPRPVETNQTATPAETNPAVPAQK